VSGIAEHERAAGQHGDRQVKEAFSGPAGRRVASVLMETDDLSDQLSALALRGRDVAEDLHRVEARLGQIVDLLERITRVLEGDIPLDGRL